MKKVRLLLLGLILLSLALFVAGCATVSYSYTASYYVSGNSGETIEISGAGYAPSGQEDCPSISHDKNIVPGSCRIKIETPPPPPTPSTNNKGKRPTY